MALLPVKLVAVVAAVALLMFLGGSAKPFYMLLPKPERQVRPQSHPPNQVALRGPDSTQLLHLAPPPLLQLKN